MTSRLPLTVEARVLSQGCPYDIFLRTEWHGADFSSSPFGFFPYHSTSARQFSVILTFVLRARTSEIRDPSKEQCCFVNRVVLDSKVKLLSCFGRAIAQAVRQRPSTVGAGVRFIWGGQRDTADRFLSDTLASVCLAAKARHISGRRTGRYLSECWTKSRNVLPVRFWARSKNCEKRHLASSCLPAWNSGASSWRIFMKFDIWGFFKNVLRKFEFD